MKYTISVLVENHPGVLSKVSGLFSRRGFNIDSLAVGVTEDSTISRMTIVVNGDEYIVEQVEKQLNKVIPVIKVKTLNPEELISRELSLIKVGCTSKQRPDLMKIAELMQANIVDVTPNSMTFQFADTGERTETLISLIKPYGIREIVRTGRWPSKKAPPLCARPRFNRYHSKFVPRKASGGNFYAKNLLPTRL